MTHPASPVALEQMSAEEIERLLRHHQELLQALRPCYHGFHADGCPRCHSKAVQDACVERLDRLTDEWIVSRGAA